jgi:hypothetical protein
MAFLLAREARAAVICARLVSQLEAYLAGTLTQAELAEWLRALSHEIRNSGDPAAVYLADEANRRLKDTSDGLMDEAGFRSMLHQPLFPHQFGPAWRDPSDAE